MGGDSAVVAHFAECRVLAQQAACACYVCVNVSVCLFVCLFVGVNVAFFVRVSACL